MSNAVETCARCLHKQVSLSSTWTQTGLAESITTTGSQTAPLPTRTSATQTDKLTELRIETTRSDADVFKSTNAESLFSADIPEQEMLSEHNKQRDSILDVRNSHQTAAPKSALPTVATTTLHLKTEVTVPTSIVVDARTESSMKESDCDSGATSLSSAQMIGLENSIRSISTTPFRSTVQLQIERSTIFENVTPVESCIIEQNCSDITFIKKHAEFDLNFSNSSKFLNDGVMDQDTCNLKHGTHSALANNSNFEDLDHDNHHSYVSTENDDNKCLLPIKKRKIPDLLNDRDSDKDIYYPATPMISLAELQDLHLPSNRQFGSFKTLAERKEMPPLPTSCIIASPAPDDHLNVNYCTTNLYHLNNLPVQFSNLPSYPIVCSNFPPFQNFNVLNLVARGTECSELEATSPDVTKSSSSKTMESPSKQNGTCLK